jgi:hypothetical protein
MATIVIAIGFVLTISGIIKANQLYALCDDGTIWKQYLKEDWREVKSYLPDKTVKS